MDDSHILMLRKLATAFRAAIETTRAERLPGALPYFPEGACRMTSRLLALYLSGRFDDDDFDRPQLVSGVLPNSEHAARHFWLEIDGAVLDLTADSFGEAPVVVGARTAFHQSLTSPVVEDAVGAVAALGADERARLERQLAVIESRLAQLLPPAA
jgi:hypothetical protein